MGNMEEDAELEEISAKLKSPYRQSLFRSCKSPFKPNTNETKSSTPLKPAAPKVAKSSTLLKNTEKELASKKGLEISSVIEKFPQIHENFEITKKAGEGTFSKVYLAKLRKDPTQIFALKHLIPTSSPGRIENELKCLQVLGGVNNVLPIRSVLRNGDHIIFILPYVPHARFTDYMQQMTVEDIRSYMQHLFVSLKHVHQLGIIHRDIKPSNFLYSHQLDEYFLIDFGLAMPVPGSENNMLNDYTNSDNNDSVNNAKSGRAKNNVNNCKHAANSICDCCKGRSRQNAPRAGTPGFRSPEVILRHPNQTTAVDMWAAGVILLSIMSQRYPFFKAKDDMEALAQIITIFGSAKMKTMADRIEKDFICAPAVEVPDDLKTLCEKLAQRACLHKSKKNSTSSDKQANMKKRKRPEASEGALLEHPKKNMTTKHLAEMVSKSESDIVNTNKKSTLIEEKENLSAETAEKKTETDNIKDSSDLDCSCRNCAKIPDSVYDLLEQLMELDPYKRISAEEALKHPFIASVNT